MRILPFLLFSLSFLPANGQTAYDIARQMFATTKQLRSLSYEMKKIERINGRLDEQRSSAKLSF